MNVGIMQVQHTHTHIYIYIYIYEYEPKGVDISGYIGVDSNIHVNINIK